MESSPRADHPVGRSKVDLVMLVLLAFVPVALLVHLLAHLPVLTFSLACLAIIPLAGLMGKATEMLAHRLGSGLGGLMNATFGNAAELVIAIMALKNGNLTIVKASLTGSIIGNLLFVLGLAAFLGGLKRSQQSFNLTAASASASMLLLTVFSLAIPALFHLFIPRTELERVELSLGVTISVILLGLYLASLVFSLKTHKHLYVESEQQEESQPAWSVKTSIGLLVLATVGVGVMAEVLLHAVDETVASVGFTETFVGVVIIAVIGNAAEHSTAVLMALKDKMNLALTIAMESSKQIALFVAPVLVLLGLAFGPNAAGEMMNLDFAPMEVAAVFCSVLIVSSICHDGKTNWLEGALLMGVYAILAAGFFFVP
ncbi:MAG: calcium/proton exchanger [Bradymonadales bacterium]|nr:calcium/proton exchanger [Bradymonadales bacterium]